MTFLDDTMMTTFNQTAQEGILEQEPLVPPTNSSVIVQNETLNGNSVPRDRRKQEPQLPLTGKSFYLTPLQLS